jgi:hypothetical protein
VLAGAVDGNAEAASKRVDKRDETKFAKNVAPNEKLGLRKLKIVIQLSPRRLNAPQLTLCHPIAIELCDKIHSASLANWPTTVPRGSKRAATVVISDCPFGLPQTTQPPDSDSLMLRADRKEYARLGEA